MVPLKDSPGKGGKRDGGGGGGGGVVRDVIGS